MNKVLKIGGIVLGGLVALLVVILILKSFGGLLSSNSTSFSDGDSMGYAGQSVGLSSPLPTGSMRSNKSLPETSPSAYESLDMQASQDLPQADKKIIKQGNLSLKVESINEALTEVTEIAKSSGGEVFSSSFYQTTTRVKSGSVTVKVPVENFDKAFNELKKVASLVVRESTSGQDVTEQYVDLKAQLGNSQAEEKSFVRILDQAQKIEDILAVTRELSRVRGTIEQLQGRLKYLEAQTDMSTITIDMSEDQNITVIDSWRPLQVVKDSFNALVKGSQGFVDSIIRFFIVILPFLIIWAVIIWIAYQLGRKIYFKLKKDKPVA